MGPLLFQGQSSLVIFVLSWPDSLDVVDGGPGDFCWIHSVFQGSTLQ